MSLLLRIFTQNVLPAFIVMGVGVILDRVLHIDKKTLSRTAIYVLTPAFVFSSLVESEVNPGQFGTLILFVFAITIAMCLIAIVVGRLLRWPAKAIDSLVLSIAFLNCGNFGLSIILFSFGETGLKLGTVFFSASTLSVNTVAAFFAARGNGGTRQALRKVLTLPGVYAFLLAILVRVFLWEVPDLVLKPLSLIGRATVPIMLMMLGVQLSQTPIGKRYKEVSVAVFLRLVVGAAVAFGLAPLLGLQGLASQVAITQASTPTAVSSALVAIEFDADAELVTSSIFFSTLLSSVTLTLVLSFLTG